MFIFRARGLQPSNCILLIPQAPDVAKQCVNLRGRVFVYDHMSELVKTGAYEFPVCRCKHYLVCVHVCGLECVNPCQTYLLAVLVRGACGWGGGVQSALVGRTGIKTDYSKAAQWPHSLSSEYGHCLCMGANWSEVECAGLYWSGLV